MSSPGAAAIYLISDVPAADKEKGANPTVTMRSFLVQLIPSLIFLSTTMILSGIGYLIRPRRKGRRSPLTGLLVRGPGYTLVQEIEKLNLGIMWCVMSIAMLPLLFYASYVSRISLGVEEKGHHTPLVYVLLLVTFTLALGGILRQLLRKRGDFRLGLDCEMAVGQTLNNLMGAGYRVYHAVPKGRRGDVDHVVVGPNGVFAVETKGRSKPKRGGGSSGVTVKYDGYSLQFPGWTDTKFLEQTRKGADWLSEWLTEKVKVPVHAHPVLVLPGWLVKKKKHDVDVLVINEKNYGFLISQRTHTALPDELIDSIAKELDKVCGYEAPTTRSLYQNEGLESKASRAARG